MFWVHEGEHGVGGGDSVSSSFNCGDGDLLGDGRIWRQLDEDWFFVDAYNPFYDILYDFRTIRAGSSHTLIGHSVVAGKIQLNDVKVSDHAHVGQLLPILLGVRCHD